MFVRISSKQLLLVDRDNKDQIQIGSTPFKGYVAVAGRLSDYSYHQPPIPEDLYDDHQQRVLVHRNKQYNPDNTKLVKRIIMLPRIGRRSVRSA